MDQRKYTKAKQPKLNLNHQNLEKLDLSIQNFTWLTDLPLPSQLIKLISTLIPIFILLVYPPTLLQSNHALWKNSLLVTFLHGDHLNRPMIMRTLAVKFTIPNPMDVICEAPNNFICRFENETDRDRIENMQPWMLHNHIVLMTRYEMGMNAAKTELQGIPVWFNLHGLHLEHQSLTIATLIASAAGNAKKILLPKGGAGFKARVEINVHQPLPQGTTINLFDGDDIWVSFEYLPLPPCFCNKCRRLGHADSVCIYLVDEHHPEVLQLEYIGKNAVHHQSVSLKIPGQEDAENMPTVMITGAQNASPFGKEKQQLTDFEGEILSELGQSSKLGPNTFTTNGSLFVYMRPNFIVGSSRLGSANTTTTTTGLRKDKVIDVNPYSLNPPSPPASAVAQAVDNRSGLIRTQFGARCRSIGRPIGAIDSKPRHQTN